MPIQVQIDGTVHEFPDDFTDADIQAALSAETPAKAGPSIADRTIDALPMIGGAVGGFAGGVPAKLARLVGVKAPNLMGTAGAALGGMAGEGFKETANALRGRWEDVPETVVGRLTKISTEGLKQGGLEGIGRGIGKGLTSIAPKIADVALSPIKSLQQKYPNIAKTYVQEGKLFSGLRGGVGAVGTKKAVEQSGALRTASRANSDRLVAEAEAAGVPAIPAHKVIRGLTPIADRASRLAETGKSDVSQKVIARGQWFAANNPTLTLTKAHETRRLLDDAADPVFKAAQRGAAPASAVREAEVDAALAGGLRKELRSSVKGLEGSDARTMELSGLTKALKDASMKRHLLTRNLGLTSGAIGVGTGLLSGDPSAGVTAGLGTLGTYYAATNPRNLGRMALGAAGAGNAMRYSPQAARALLALMQSHQSEP